MQGRAIDASINATGRAQALAIAEYLKDKPVSLIVTSGLKRTLETAQPSIEYHQARVQSFEELDEMSFGELEGKEFFKVKEEIRRLHENWSSGNTRLRTPGGEHPEEVLERADAKIRELLGRSEDEHIVLMLHGRLIRILLSEWLGYGLQNMHRIQHCNGSINHLIWDGQKFEAVALNITDHLEELVNN